MDDMALAHHGIKGMRWGIRRTPAQLGHRAPSKTAKRAREQSGRSAGSKKNVHELSDAELREAISRLELEKRYRELARSSEPPKTNEGKKFVENVIKKSGENIATQFRDRKSVV